MKTWYRSIFVLPAVFISFLGQAQDHRFTVEPRVGVSVSSMFGARSPFVIGNFSMSPLSSFNAGVNFGVRLNSKFSLVTGYSFDTRGGHGEYRHESFVVTPFGPKTESESHFVSVQNQYHNFFVFLRFGLASGRGWKLDLEAGLFASRLQSSSVWGSGAIFYEPAVGDGYQTGFACSAKGPDKGQCVYSFETDDPEFTHTSESEFGPVVGVRISIPISGRLLFSVNPQFICSLNKIDGKYSDDLLLIPTTGSTFYWYQDYHNLSSFSRQYAFCILAGITVGIGKLKSVGQ